MTLALWLYHIRRLTRVAARDAMKQSRLGGWGAWRGSDCTPVMASEAFLGVSRPSQAELDSQPVRDREQ